MKLAILGGSAPSTPHLLAWEGLRPVHSEIEVALIGRSSARLDGVARAVAQMTTGRSRISCASFDAEDLRRALLGADLVLLQVRCGGYSGRSFDETFPLRYGICGDEGLGPGGLSAAWRAWPELRPLFDAMRETCPNAAILVMTSPVSLLTRCARAAYPELASVGICELPWTTLQDVCDACGADPFSVSFRYAGVNHLGWFSDIRSGSRDVSSEFVATRSHADGFPSSALIAACGGIPLKYLRLHYEREAVVRAQSGAATPRGAELEALQSRAIETFSDGAQTDIAAALATRPAPWYAHAVGPVVASFAGQPSKIPLFLSGPNRGGLQGFDETDVLEYAHRVEGRSFVRLDGTIGIPGAARTDLESIVGYERAAARALLADDPSLVAEALACHPWVGDRATASALAREITSQPKVYPPAARATSRT
jgi:6-phospho-beta-glucosidase